MYLCSIPQSSILFKPLSHQAALPLRWHGIILQRELFCRAARVRKKALILFVKKSLSRRPYSDHSVATELACRSIALLRSLHGVLSRSYGVLVGDSLHSRASSAQNTCTARSRRSYCTEGVLKRSDIKERRTISVPNDHGVCTTQFVRSREAPIALQNFLRCYGDHTATPLCSY